MTHEIPPPGAVRNNDASRRFELAVDGVLAFIDYRPSRDGALALIHTEVPVELEGHGVGTALVQGALELSRAAGMQVLPFCPFVHAFIRRHGEYRDMVSERYPGREALG